MWEGVGGHRARLALGLLALSGLVACEPVDVEGDWTGTWQNRSRTADGTLALSLVHEDDDSVRGSFELGGTACVGSGSVTGTLERRKLKLQLANSVGGALELDGNVSTSGARYEGSFDVSSGFCEGAAGSFELSKVGAGDDGE